MIIRRDFLQDRKTVQISLEKSTFAELKKKLYDYEITMKQAFFYFAKMLVEGDSNALKVLEKVNLNVIKGRVEHYENGRNKPIDKLDQELLYNLIEKIQNDNEEEQR